MPASAATYRRIPGTIAFRWASLYLGPDHLLDVTSFGFSESYRRYYFRDIQTITLFHTYTGRIWNCIWGGLALLFLVLALGIGQAALLPLLAFSGAFAIPFSINVALGPTCASYLKTAVQTRRLLSVGRVWRARKLAVQLIPLIAQAQGEMAAEEIRQRTDASAFGRAYSPDVSPMVP